MVEISQGDQTGDICPCPGETRSTGAFTLWFSVLQESRSHKQNEAVEETPSSPYPEL